MSMRATWCTKSVDRGASAGERCFEATSGEEAMGIDVDLSRVPAEVKEDGTVVER